MDQTERLCAEIVLCLQPKACKGARGMLERVLKRKPLGKALVQELCFINLAAQNDQNRMIDAEIIMSVKAVVASREWA